MQARHPSANITLALGSAVLLCFSPQLTHGQVAAQTQAFVVHGTQRTCSTITQLDSALSESYQQFFAGWTEKDYVDAIAWSQACSEYGWHIPGRPRIALLQAQHDKSLGSAQTQIVPSTATAGASPSVPAQATLAAQVQPAAGAATGSALPSTAVQAAQAQTVSGTAAGSALPSAPADAAISSQVQAVSSPAAGSALPSTAVQAAQAQTVSSTAAGSALPSAPADAAISSQVQSVSSPAAGSALPSTAAQASVPAQAQTVSSTGASSASALASPPVTADIPAQTQLLSSASAGIALPSAPAEAAMAAQVLPVSRVTTGSGSALPSTAVQAGIPAQAQPVSSATTGIVLPSPAIRDRNAYDGEGDSLLTDDYVKKHFHQESLWVANKANLDIGDDRGPSSWPSNEASAQMKNRITADRIVLYCTRKTDSGESHNRPLLWDLRWCEAEEAAAYNRLVSENEFPAAGRGIILGCANVDSYVYLERCMETLTAAQKH